MAYANNGDCRIWYETRGQGPPLVMVYGIGGRSADWWEPFFERLEPHHTLVLLDNRGTGNSDKPETPWTMEDMTADVMAVVEDAGLDTFHLLGCSLGSVIVRHVVRTHGGERLRSLSLLCPPNGIAATDEDLRKAIFWDTSKPLVDNARGSWPIVHPASWAEENDDLLLRKFEESMQNPTPARTFQYQFQAAGDAPDPVPAINAHDWPVLVLHGTVDRLVPPANATTLAESIPRARLEWLEGDGHCFWQHDPDGGSAVLLDFLAAAERRATAR